jgi:hypothetical protein
MPSDGEQLVALKQFFKKGSGTADDPFEDPVVPMSKVEELMPWQSKIHRFFHVNTKTAIRWFINRTGESKKMKKVWERKEQKGFINPEAKAIYDSIMYLVQFERNLWANPDAKTLDPKYKGEVKNGNERMWMNLAKIVGVMADEDSYYLLRELKRIDWIIQNQHLFRLDWHRKQSYWDTSDHAMREAIKLENMMKEIRGS